MGLINSLFFSPPQTELGSFLWKPSCDWHRAQELHKPHEPQCTQLYQTSLCQQDWQQALLVGALLGTTHALPPASLWLHRSATRLVGLRKPPAITLGRSALCSRCASSRQLLIIVVDVIIIHFECIRREDRMRREVVKGWR